MAGKHFAFGRRNRTELLVCIIVQLVEHVLVIFKTLLVIAAACRVGLNQRNRHVGGIALHQHRVVPHMRVKFAMIVIMVVAVFVMMLIGSQGLDAGGGFGRGHFALLHRALQLGFF